MLIKFTIENFSSFKDRVTLSMEKTSLSEYLETHVFKTDDDGPTLLKSAGVFGPNASGKSNLLWALRVMRNMVVNSAKGQEGDPIGVINFELNTVTEKKPSYFEIQFRQAGTTYRYGFEADKERVHREWLYGTPNVKEVEFFNREGQEITLSSYFKGEGALKNMARSNALFLSVAAQLNAPTAKELMAWFRSVRVIRNRKRTEGMLQDDLSRSDIVQFLKAADIGILGVEIEEKILRESDLPTDMSESERQRLLKDPKIINIYMTHAKYDGKGNIAGQAKFPQSYESEGTDALFDMFGAIKQTIETGGVLIADEIEAHLHPEITEFVLKQFHNADNKHAQLIFATHYPDLMGLLRRDQIWFTEKDKFGASQLFSLADFEEPPRKDASLAKRYRIGKFGAIPNVDDFFFLGPKSNG
jgi:AAA15 family ATPase/GTPase